ncbi:LOW QUALITY PROTEIN: F-actin-monooxygenase mical2b-like [Neosynchiropus ocellatus]
MGEMEDERTAQAGRLFENFVQMSTCKGTLQAFSILCRQLDLDPLDHSSFYGSLKAALTSWKVKALWTKLDKRAQQKVYGQSEACQGTRCLVVGGGPCGLRTAVELALLGCKVVVIEKRDAFSRNNVLHLWPFAIHDLRGLGAKKFYGKFCAGSIDHISIRQLQLMLLKICLILGVEIHVNVEFSEILEPSEDPGGDGAGWRAEVRPAGHCVSDMDFDVVIGADGRRNTLHGFSRKEFRGKLAIAITANFVNRNTTAEAKVEEISGVAFIFNQKFFLELKEETGIDLENIVYYRDNTHYFVMTAKKQSLLDKGVIISDHSETERLLRSDNVRQEALLSYAREAADFGTNYQLPSLDYALNHRGQPDVAMFDFTSMYASENAALIRERHGRRLLVALVGDSLLEPFWPMGTGCARGFLAAFDTAWMVRGHAQGGNPLEVLAERRVAPPPGLKGRTPARSPDSCDPRERLYRLLPQTTTENISKNFDQYSIDPTTRYPNLNSSCVRPHQVRHLFVDGQQDSGFLERRGPGSLGLKSDVRPARLLAWCQKQTQGYRGVEVTDLTWSWRSGLALCALIHRQRPHLIDFDSLNGDDVVANNRRAFDVAERQLGIQPVTTGEEMAAGEEPDKLLMVFYLSKFYEAFRNAPGHGLREADENGEDPAAVSVRKRIPKVGGAGPCWLPTALGPTRVSLSQDGELPEDDSASKRRRKGDSYLAELSCHSGPPAGENGELRDNKVRSMATQLLAKFEENASTGTMRPRSDEDLSDASCSPPSSPLPLTDEDNPRFAKPKEAPPPPTLTPRRPKWQPSVYLRLLEDPSSVVPREDSCRSPSPCFLSRPPSPELQHPECTSPDPSAARSPVSAAAPPRPQSESRTVSSRDLSGRSIKERATLLASLFPDSVRPARCSRPQVALSSASSLFSPPGESLPYPAVHPVPDPAALTGFSSDGFHAVSVKHQKVSVDPEKPEPLSARNQERVWSDDIVAGLSNLCCERRRSSFSCLDAESAERPAAGRSPSQTLDRGSPVESGGPALHSWRGGLQSLSRSDSCPPAAPRYSKERTVGKVSSSIDAKAQVLALLYETDHRPGSSPCLPSGPGSDVCHFCSRRVYVMERLSAEGFFFHRECFRCHVCSRALRPGGHAYDSHHAKFYCRTHYSQLQSSARAGPFRRRKDVQSSAPSLQCDGGSLGARTPAAPAQYRPATPDQKPDPDVTSGSPTSAVVSGREEVKEPDSKPNLRWRNKIRTTFPLLFVRHLQRARPPGSDPPETVPEVDSDFEEIQSETPDTKGTSCSVPEPTRENTSTSSTEKKRLILSQSDREKLLDWDLLPEEEVLHGPLQASAESAAVEPPRDSGQTPSTLQLIASAFRRTFSFSSSGHRRRPVSEGALSFLFSSLAMDSCEATRSRKGDLGRDLPALLQQVSLKNRRDSGGVFSDESSGPPHRAVNLFSSLRLKKKGEGQREVRNILNNLRNKAPSPRDPEDPSSDEEEDRRPSRRRSADRRQETTVAQQNKRRQLKRLHRAQTIQRQLEEVGEKQRAVEERGVEMEKMIRGDAGPSLPEDEAQLYQSWFQLVMEKNRLERYESELLIHAQELQLEDTQCRLEQEYRRRTSTDDARKSSRERRREEELLSQIMRTVERRDMLVSAMERQRLQERAEDRDLESLLLSRGYDFHWAPTEERWSSPGS